jgi:hypothetical protein
MQTIDFQSLSVLEQRHIIEFARSVLHEIREGNFVPDSTDAADQIEEDAVEVLRILREEDTHDEE